MSALWEKFDGAGAPCAGECEARPRGHDGTPPVRAVGRGRGDPADYATLWKYVLDDMPGRRPGPADLGHEGRALDGQGRLRPGIRTVGAGDPRDGSGAVAKQGWMCCFSGQYYLHTAGVVDPEDALRRGAADPPAANDGLAVGRGRNRPGSRRRRSRRLG
jgi:hypothetical protein